MGYYRPREALVPEANTRAVVFGSRKRMMTAANLYWKRLERKNIKGGVWVTLGLYSAFLAFKAICFKSSLQLKLTVETIFLYIMLKTLEERSMLTVK